MISVLTVNYHSAAELAELAASIERLRGEAAVELVVTNNSPSEPIALGPAWSGRHEIIEAANVGYGRGINLAAAAARGDTLMLANPDLRLRAGVLAGAAAYLAEHADVGALLPRLIAPDGGVQQSVRRFYTWSAALYARCPLRDLIAHPGFFRRYLMLDDDLSRPCDVDWGLGGAMFLRRADFPGGAIFDPRFHLYFEDVDLCLRLWRGGRRVVYHPDLICDHAHRRDSRSAWSKQGLHHLASTLKFIARHRGFPQRLSRGSLQSPP